MNIEQVTKATADKPVVFEVFWSRSSSIQYVFKDGRYAKFADFKFYTDHAEHIRELKAEIAAGHPSLYQEDGKETVEKDADPMAGLKAKIRAELIAEEKAKMAAISGTNTRDMGNTEPVKFVPLSTTDVAQGAADSTGNPVGDFLSVSNVDPAVAAGLAALTAKAPAKK